MGFVNNLKNNIRKEIDAVKYNTQLENDPLVVRNRLDAQRKEISIEKERLLTQKQLEQDKRELQTLKNSTGIRGQITSGLGKLKTHLNDVKERNARLDLKDPLKKSDSSKFDIKGSSSVTESPGMHHRSKGSGSYRPFGSGVMSDSPLQSKKRKRSKDQTIVIKVGR